MNDARFHPDDIVKSNSSLKYENPIPYIGSGKIRVPWGAVEGFFIGCDIFLMCPTDNMRTRYNISTFPKHPASANILYIQVRYHFSLTYLNMRHSSLIFAYIQFCMIFDKISIKYLRPSSPFFFSHSLCLKRGCLTRSSHRMQTRSSSKFPEALRRDSEIYLQDVVVQGSKPHKK